MTGSNRTHSSSKYERIVAVDRMRPWSTPGGVSDNTDDDKEDS